MFSATDIKAMKDATPFKPFRLWMNDGSSVEVPRRDVALVTRNYLTVGTNFNRHDIPRDAIRCAYSNISRVEEMEAA